MEKDKPYISTVAEIRFDYLDRIRVLFKGYCSLRIETVTERNPGKCQSTSKVFVPKIFKPIKGGMEVSHGTNRE